ncbi:hypothetical protein GCM10027280_20330 [Micromonospora polyrhachis]|uniref:Signal peptidase I n=1 Tax=Micromonospora polyrhachis TaxID=1282883 RepID=A0A7W7SWA0_9ACTN|nr:S26 family signal peptidase [Micromonospora polyrhachis]MBB4961751.1 signal peptidase I [Micromonospora polyrhachis]
MGTAVVVIVVAGVLASVVAALVWLRRRLLIVSVVGRSMEPTLRPGDRVLARRVPLAAIRRGDVVVVVAPVRATTDSTRLETGAPALLIKRAYAVPGDPVPVDRVPILRREPEPVVPADRLVVLGDNPPVSYDSRECGYITGQGVLGVVIRPRLPSR